MYELLKSWRVTLQLLKVYLMAAVYYWTFSQGKRSVWLSVFSHMQQWSRGILMYIMVKSERLIWLVMPKTRWLLEVKDLREIFWNNDHCHTSKYLLFPPNLTKCYYKKNIAAIVLLWLRIQWTPYNCLFLLTPYVVLDYYIE